MSYTDHISSEPEQSPEPKKRMPRFWSGHQLHEVTWFSKILALLLFVFLPFGGFWLGLQHVPVVYVEAPTQVEDSSEDPDDLDTAATSTPPAAATSTTGAGLLREFADPETGVRFSYPVEWGAISSSNEPGDCPSGYDADSCLLRMYSVQDPGTGQSAVFLVAATAGHGEYPVGRGAFWGDLVHRQSDDFVSECQANESCAIEANQHGHDIAVHASLPVGAPSGAESDPDAWYFTRSSSDDFDRFALTASELRQAEIDAVEQFETVVASLQIE